MRPIVRVVFSACLLVSVGLVSPVPAKVPPSPKSDCCSQAAAATAKQSCPHERKLPQDFQCCVACASCLAAVLNVPVKVSPPSYREQFFAEFFENTLARPERPLVPPPRVSLA